MLALLTQSDTDCRQLHHWGQRVSSEKGTTQKDFGFAVPVKTGAGKLSRGALATSDKYLGDRSQYAHAITAMVTITRAGLEPKVYFDSRNFYFFPTSSIRAYTSATQRDDDAVSLEPDIFIPGMVVDSGVHYNVKDVPYKPSVAVPFTECPESADPHSIAQDDNVIHLKDTLNRATHYGTNFSRRRLMSLSFLQTPETCMNRL